MSHIIFFVISPPNPCGIIFTNSQINPGTTDDNINSKVRSIKILLDSGASTLIVHDNILQKYYRILKDKKNKCSTMVGTFSTTFVTEIILKLPQLNHSTHIYAKCYLTNKLLNYNLILGRDILHELGIIFYVETKTITWQEVSISMKPPNCTTKEFFVIKKSWTVWNGTARMKHEFKLFKGFTWKFLFELLQKYEKMFYRILGNIYRF